jgi:hypothetical protein
LLASRMKRRRSSAGSFNAADFDMNTIWPNQALERTQHFVVSSRSMHMLIFTVLGRSIPSR